MTTNSIRLLNLTAVDHYQLTRLLNIDEPSQEEASDIRHGEPASLTISLVLTAPVLQALSLWLLQKRRKRSVKLHIERTKPDGELEIVSLTIDLSDSGIGSEEVIRQILNGLSSTDLEKA